MGLEYADIDVKQILRKATREDRNIFGVFKVKEKGELLVANKWRWYDSQRHRKSQEEKAGKESQGLEEEDKRKSYEDAARKILKYLEDSEDLKVGLSEFKEQLETPEGASISIMQIAKQATKREREKLFQIFRQEENEVYIASSARWGPQLKGLVELERRCQDLMQEVKFWLAWWYARGTCRKRHQKVSRKCTVSRLLITYKNS